MSKAPPATLAIIVLELHPGAFRDQIVCSTESVLFSSRPTYETLSYVWGDPSTTTDIMIDGSRRSVTQTLHEALQRLRLPDRHRRLWIDQLCIDQANQTVKSQQVDCMHDIYRNCAHNNIWFGEIPSEADAGFTVQIVADVFDLLTRLDPDHPSNAGKAFPYDQPWDPVLDTPVRFGQVILAMMGSTIARWKGVQWWHRVWTVQEARMPRTSSILWSDLTVSFNTITRCAIYMRMSRRFNEKFNMAFHLGHLANEFRAPLFRLHCHEPPTDAVSGPLFRWRSRLATDPRDKIFALMAVFQDDLPFLSLPFCDYSLSVQELYMLVTFDLIKRHEGLLVLCGRRGEPHGTSGLPSWVVDWVAPEEYEQHTLDYFGHRERYEFFTVAGGRHFEPTFIPGKDSEVSALQLRGLEVDRIAVLGPVNCVSNRKQTQIGPLAYVEQIRATVLAWQRVFETWFLAQPAVQSYLGQDFMTPWEAFCRTMTSDLVHDVTRGLTGRTEAKDALDVELFLDGSLDGSENLIPGCVGNMARSQAFFITEKGYIGIGPPETRIGDEVWALFCGNVPMVLRPREEGKDGFVLVGDAYVQGIMDGEVVDCGTDGKVVVIY
ncbi:heterokaryon incompatibility protein-domain-containing protein [Plectosphaerella plurivora]|uniref:Heterokaryon incompatibility protein-domain-containing protein n=1 Tax=Plectosphaerella plurivora TaxID=936078 RepID=A0A9P9A9T4_9PEZI|nr:heterokaryon incompatibility protein-domain-containing protein [Plectosphaerella plurivora]